MLYFAEDKRTVKPFGRILEGVESFLELCEPESRCPLYIRIAEGENLKETCGRRYLHDEHYLREGYDPGFVRHFLGGNDFTVLGPEQMTGKLSLLPDIAEDSRHEVDIRWFPLVRGSGQAPISMFHLKPCYDFERPLEEQLADVVNFIHVGQAKNNPIEGTSWFLVYLATPYQEPDADFLRFYEEANKRSPLKLQKNKWRRLTMSASGRPVIRKIKW